MLNIGLGIHHNFGRHINKETLPLLTGFYKGAYAFEVVYNPACALPKLSMLALYWRIFNVDSVSFRIPIWVTAALTVAWLISMVGGFQMP